MAPTLEQIAELSGVSRATVSRVINDGAGVSPATRARVRTVIDRVGYTPNLMARSLASGRATMLAVVAPEDHQDGVTDSDISQVLHGITREADIRKGLVTLFLAGSGLRRIENAARSDMVDGAILLSGGSGDPAMEDPVKTLLESEIPCVTVGGGVAEGVGSVDVDDVAGAYRATSHLLRLGRSRIAFISGPPSSRATADRLRGYRAALEEHGIAVDRELIATAGPTDSTPELTMRRLLAATPDAVLAAGSSLAMACLDALRAAGRRVPDDVAVVGFGDSAFARTMEPPLTTVGPSAEELGGAAVNLLFDLIDDPDATRRRVLLPAELVVRASCGAYLNNERKARSAY